jgi:hypothetical protein
VLSAVEASLGARKLYVSLAFDSLAQPVAGVTSDEMVERLAARSNGSLSRLPR